jgi:hypothetical protein
MFSLAEALSGEEADVPAALTPYAYRSLDAVVSDVLDRARERQTREWSEREDARRIAVRRIARTVAGATALLAGLTTFVCALASLPGGGLVLASPQWSYASTCVLLCAWPLALAAGAVARVVVGASTVRRLHAPVAVTGPPGGGLVMLEGADTLGAARAMAARWERASTALPLAALSMTAPLTIHFVVWSLLVGPTHASARDFGQWIAASVVIVGHAHLALAACAARWAYKLRERESWALGAGVGASSLKALFLSVGVACLPGVLLIGLPPVLVLVTGIAFVPAMYMATASCLRRERLALDS